MDRHVNSFYDTESGKWHRDINLSVGYTWSSHHGEASLERLLHNMYF